MENLQKKDWLQKAEAVVNHYLNLGDGGFDECMKANFVCCDYDEQSITIGFLTQKWQINERGGIHGGAITGMFDTALGAAANFIAGKGEATTVEMIVNFLRPLELGQTCQIKVLIVKTGRKLIRLRAECSCPETGKLIATGSGSWMPL